MSATDILNIIEGIRAKNVVPYLGPGILFDATSKLNGLPIPADSDSLILAMNGGKPMAPKLMYEFPRAAMNLELKRGRSFVTQFLDKTYRDSKWTTASLHSWLAAEKPHYVIDINRDTQLQESYAGICHTLIVGLSRVVGNDYRFKIFGYDGEHYEEIDQDRVDPTRPILFKPMGTPRPESHYIASDADYVDYITELMGGFGIPRFLKEYRKGKKYLLLGLPLNRDSERMVMADITYDADDHRGWFFRKNPTEKEKRFAARIGFDIIEADCRDFLAAVQTGAAAA